MGACSRAHLTIAIFVTLLQYFTLSAKVFTDEPYAPKLHSMAFRRKSAIDEEEVSGGSIQSFLHTASSPFRMYFVWLLVQQAYIDS